MKALASEMTASFGKRLKGLGIVVKELTGDMKLTKTEVQQTQMIVTTPEKWDVVTRKGASKLICFHNLAIPSKTLTHPTERDDITQLFQFYIA